MRPGIESAVGSVECIVSDAMTAQLDGRDIHPVYSTFWACYHCEVAARRAIEPYFEDDEDAVGSALSLQHRAMAAIGAELLVTARVSRVEGNRVTCTVQITTKHSEMLLAEGTQEQAVLSRSRLSRLVDNALKA
jgi:fluoroacetyl-CoA thioesterase